MIRSSSSRNPSKVSKKSAALASGFLALVSAVSAERVSFASGPQVDVFWTESVDGNPINLLRTWTLDELRKLKKTTLREKDPESGKLVRWDGVKLSEVLEAVLSGMPADRKAQIDLIILRGQAGQKALIPRAYLVKYPFLLALSRDLQDLGKNGPVFSVAPWTSASKILQEGAPLETFFVSQVSRVELANYRALYGGLFLKRRTDPGAMRGERLFVQNCLGCHAGGQGPSLQTLAQDVGKRALASSGHPAVKGAPKLNDRDRKYLVNYLEAFRAENVPSSAKQDGPTTAATTR